MGYYIRVLGTKSENISLGKLREAASPAVIEIAGGSDDSWSELILAHELGDEIAVIERNPVIEEELGADELTEFIEEVSEYKPDSAVSWLKKYLPTVKVIYAFQLLGRTDVDDGWTSLHGVHAKIWNIAGGILQADGEGFSNEAGHTILWQFGDSVSGSWQCAVFGEDEKWTSFEMELGSLEQRDAFQRGQVPNGAKLH
jgi:hypothetical protein